ncbi:hypothetical protein Tco_0639213 [Tanacetum coccineum]
MRASETTHEWQAGCCAMRGIVEATKLIACVHGVNTRGSRWVVIQAATLYRGATNEEMARKKDGGKIELAAVSSSKDQNPTYFLYSKRLDLYLVTFQILVVFEFVHEGF